jgi:hypothetical protein
VNENVPETIGNRKFSFETANVVYGGGEVLGFLNNVLCLMTWFEMLRAFL